MQTASTSWKHRHSFSVFIVEIFLHFHQTQGHNLSWQTSHSVVLPSSLLSWQNPWWVDILLSDSNWKPIFLLSETIFTLIKKSLRDLFVGNDNFFDQTNFLLLFWLHWFFCFHCCKSVSYDFHCIILFKQMSYQGLF